MYNKVQVFIQSNNNKIAHVCIDDLCHHNTFRLYFRIVNIGPTIDLNVAIIS